MPTTSLVQRAQALLAIIACLALLARVVDVGSRWTPATTFAPPPPAEAAERDATLVVRVLRSATAPVSGASVRVFWERGGMYYAAGSARSDGSGQATLTELPRGSVWILVDAEGLARSSTRLVLEGGARSAEVMLSPASQLAVTLSDEQGATIASGTVLVTTGDPLPFGALTSDDGVARFTALPPSPWTVRGSALGYESITESGVTRDVTLVLRRLGSLEVHVVGADGKPVSDATVTIAGSSLWPARRAQTDSGGTARISGLLAGTYDLQASAGHWVSDTLVGFELARGGHASITLELRAGRMVTALVVDDDTDHPGPIRDADVVLTEGGLSSFPVRGRTGSDGSVTLGPIPAAPATLSASADGFVTRGAVAVPDVIDGPVRIVLVRGATLEGDVVDVKDRPVDGASIEVIGSDLTGLPVADSPERISFRRSHFSWSLGGPRPLIPAGELGVMPGPIPPIPRGAGLPDLPAAEPGEVGAGASVEPWVTRLDGTFKAFPVTPGRVRALVRHPAYVEGISEAITLAPGASGKVKVVLLAGGTLEGRLVDSAGRGVSNARIDLTAVRGTLERTTITASDGTFAFAAVPDQVIVSAARPDDPSKLVVKKSVEVPEGGRAKVEITLPAPRDALRVVVRDDSGRPVESAQVSVLSVDPNAPLRQTAFTGSDGSAAIEDARGLDLRILVEAPGFAVAVRSVEHAGERVQIDLARGVTVEGKVTTVRGRRPLEGASITLISEGRRSFALSDRDGAYRMRDVAPGPVHVVVTHPDFATAELDTTVVSTGRSDRAHELPAIDLAEGGGIEGEVLDAQGKPAVGARVAAGIVPAFLPLGSLPPGMAVTDGKGRFKLAGLAPGRVDVEAYAPDLGRGVARRVSVAAGRNTTGVSIRLTAPVGDADPSVTGSVAITLGERGEGEGLEVVIVHVADGSEAERGGLRAGDVVLAVDGADVADMRDARARLSGPPNSDVVVEVDRAGQTLKLRVGREAIRR